MVKNQIHSRAGKYIFLYWHQKKKKIGKEKKRCISSCLTGTYACILRAPKGDRLNLQLQHSHVWLAWKQNCPDLSAKGTEGASPYRRQSQANSKEN